MGTFVNALVIAMNFVWHLPYELCELFSLVSPNVGFSVLVWDDSFADKACSEFLSRQ